MGTLDFIEVKREHQKILMDLNRSLEMDIQSIEGQRHLKRCKLLIINHFMKEEACLYPKLKKEALSNPRLSMKVNLLHRELDNMIDYIMRVFKRYIDKLEYDIDNFKLDMKKMINILKVRMIREEKALYEELELIDKFRAA